MISSYFLLVASSACLRRSCYFFSSSSRFFIASSRLNARRSTAFCRSISSNRAYSSSFFRFSALALRAKRSSYAYLLAFISSNSLYTSSFFLSATALRLASSAARAFSLFLFSAYSASSWAKACYFSFNRWSIACILARWALFSSSFFYAANSCYTIRSISRLCFSFCWRSYSCLAAASRASLCALSAANCYAR